MNLLLVNGQKYIEAEPQDDGQIKVRCGLSGAWAAFLLTPDEATALASWLLATVNTEQSKSR